MEYLDIEEYINLSRDERRAHLDLNEPCLKIGGSSRNFRGLLAHHLKTTIPSGFKILLCHACNDGECSNPKHLYWGTTSDNVKDSIESGTYISPKLSNEQRKKIGKSGAEGLRRKRAEEIISGKRKVTKNTSPLVLALVEQMKK